MSTHRADSHTASHTFSAWSCTVRLVVADGRVLAPAVEDLIVLLDRVDRAASRFRPDSALSQTNARAGRPTPIPTLLVDLVATALAAAVRTDGAVDPLLGATLAGLGYDRDIAEVRAGRSRTAANVRPRPDVWRGLRLDRRLGILTVPRGTALDLGATAKAWTADRAATTLAARYGTGVLVELGGDIAVAGDNRDNPSGWTVQVAERAGTVGQQIALHRGGLTTSTTTVRTWEQEGRPVHHIIDPRTGRPADGPWRTATVAGDSAVDANIASTAAIVLGDAAPAWLERRGLAARLVHRDGSIRTVAGWPEPSPADERVLTGARS